MQKTLSEDQVKDFYHDLFVRDQIDSFSHALGNSLAPGAVVVDVGGGCGFFAQALAHKRQVVTRVMDTDPTSIKTCLASGLQAELSDALAPNIKGDESVVCFNLILHHLVGESDAHTQQMQSRALRAWLADSRSVFVNEYIYESFLHEDIAARLIWGITSNKFLSGIGRAVSVVVPSLRANTFGVGVRFRSASDWKSLFATLGFDVVEHVKGIEEKVSLARRLLLIKHGRRDSFLLRPRVQGQPRSTRVVELSAIRA